MGRLILTGYEKKLRIDQHQGKSKKARRRKWQELQEVPNDNDEAVERKVIRLTSPAESSADMPVATREQFPSLESWVTSEMSKNRAAGDTTSIPYSEWNFSAVLIPCVENDHLQVQRPPERYLPPGSTWPTAASDELSVTLNTKSFQESYEDHLEFSRGGSAWKKSIKARNWGEYKKEKQCGGVGLTPAAPLWAGDITPLVKPQDSTSTGMQLL